ncbi:hypothetical protein BO85DRAFT_54240 [Aspergillus piperis CBS 112811]|uniref:Uncharacterized protein n=1 Tax=Aspergillus piperis CBS 112811 TaxID=1448313 RepID=A0A8G1QY74_9EURO|nr:hypothetical protein BO85DRAFT_54240 [Aspergillus piperis CBS 112811]RAH56591.1 hypothetical protein BO85DRAFT_54240 [Aspergillus piperis CBS 112811]
METKPPLNRVWKTAIAFFWVRCYSLVVVGKRRKRGRGDGLRGRKIRSKGTGVGSLD